MLTFSSNLSKKIIATRTHGVCCLLFFSSFFNGRTGTDVAERRASTVGRTLKVLKGCILQQQSVMRAHASGISQGAEGVDGNLSWSWRFSLWYGGGADDYRSVCRAVVA